MGDLIYLAFQKAFNSKRLLCKLATFGVQVNF